ncbi:hypothetical protein P3102_07700 [Amycolatopsis sp. QT-25]|uniref:hypothetical protein n=1 Tax=Amycolatopsis sp. QT-25 TaxID=3034022 RepID=UPI0023EAF940|nr:hypothetical protein [Amycolatopsis sp. QT-25]WET81099.1 hypothetical protein P3102_07700 [Amycolatopsis sp. QT-25]
MVDSTYDWLPERHLGVAATLSHADELIEQVSDLLFEYQARSEGVFGLREVPAGPVSRTVVDRVAVVPRKVPLLVADALVALRAALEHVLFAEVEFVDGAPLGEKAARLVEMPALDTYEKFEAWRKGREKNGPLSLRAGSELLRRVAGLQPFQRQVEPQMHPLARLVVHTNHAKHRTPAVATVRLAAMYRGDQVPRSIEDLPQQPEKPLRVGDVIAETPIGTRVPLTLFPTVVINRPGTERWPVLMQELDEISQWVRCQAVPRLITGSEPPQPPLPARYKIGIGHQDERRAIAAGPLTSAASRHTQRLSAASARNDLVGLLGQIDGFPSAQQVSAWLARLADEEVLDKISTLKQTHDYDPHVMRHNAEVLTRLRDEILNFARNNKPAEE